MVLEVTDHGLEDAVLKSSVPVVVDFWLRGVGHVV
jgi:thioredoxin-like negative regulator of GroEL